MTHRILIVDDDPMVQRFAAASLCIDGVAVRSADSGGACLDLLRQGYRPDLLLLDLLMPAMDGLAVLAAGEAEGLMRGFPVAVLTTESQRNVVERAARFGVASYIVKPTTAAILRERVARLLSPHGAAPAPAGQDPQRELADLRADYAADLPRRRVAAQAAWAALATGDWSPEGCRPLYLLAHSLAGSGSSFGFPEVTRHATEVEMQLKGLVDGAPEAHAAAALRQAIANAVANLLRSLEGPAATPAPSLAGTSAPGAAGLRRILVVDDEKGVQLLARLALGKVGGFEVVTASSGQEALALVATQRPDLILLDLMMPGMDGPATLAALHRLPSPPVPVIFVTATAQAADAAQRAGVLGVLTKPFDATSLASQVQALWRRSAT